ncbi:MAG: hypothetical protein LCI02_23155 [Proteobacteria bacterium]|nr:hypothetical protein [Pseudomonadota bacterium]
MRLASTFTLVALLGTTAHANTHGFAEAILTVRSYSAALSRGDCKAALALISPAIAKRLGRAPDGKEAFCEYVASTAARGQLETIGTDISTLASGSHRATFIRVTRFALGRQRIARTKGGVVEVFDPGFRSTYQGTYIVHSADDGATWHVLDLACVDQRWIKEVYPSYDGRPRVSVATQRFEQIR